MSTEYEEIESTLDYLFKIQDIEGSGMIDDHKMLNLIESLSCDFTKERSIKIKESIKNNIRNNLLNNLNKKFLAVKSKDKDTELLE